MIPGLPDLWLLRHGETEWNKERRMQGRRDSALTALGRAQAARQAKLIPTEDVTRVASPLGRARQSAEIVFGGLPFTTDERLAEIDIGAWSGQMLTDLTAQHPQLFSGHPLDWYNHAPGGEGLAGLEARARAFLASLDRPTVAVTHGITLRMLRALTQGLPFSGELDTRFPQDAVHRISGGRAELVA